MICVYGDQRQFVDKFHALTQDILRIDTVRIRIVGIQCQDTSLECVHDVAVGSLHDYVTDETVTEILEGLVHAQEDLHLLIVRKMAEQEQVTRLLESETSAFHAIHNIAYIYALIIERTVGRYLITVLKIKCHDIGDLRKSGQDALSG